MHPDVFTGMRKKLQHLDRKTTKESVISVANFRHSIELFKLTFGNSNQRDHIYFTSSSGQFLHHSDMTYSLASFAFRYINRLPFKICTIQLLVQTHNKEMALHKQRFGVYKCNKNGFQAYIANVL